MECSRLGVFLLFEDDFFQLAGIFLFYFFSGKDIKATHQEKVFLGCGNEWGLFTLFTPVIMSKANAGSTWLESTFTVHCLMSVKHVTGMKYVTCSFQDICKLFLKFLKERFDKLFVLCFGIDLEEKKTLKLLSGILIKFIVFDSSSYDSYSCEEISTT